MLAKKPKGAVERKRGGGIASLLWMFVGAILTIMFGLFIYLWNPFDIGSETTVEERDVEPINQETSQTGDYEFYDLLPEQEITSIPDEAIIDDNELTIDSDSLEPDVVISAPTPQEREPELNTGNYGVAENSGSNQNEPQQAQGEQQIVIVEEEGTYDEPLNNGNGANSNGNGANGNGANTRNQDRVPAQNNNNRNANSAAPAQSAASAQPKQSYILQINSFSNAQEADKRRAQVLMAGVDAHVVKNKLANGQVLYQVVSSNMTSRQSVIAAQQKLQNNGIDSLIVEQRR